MIPSHQHVSLPHTVISATCSTVVGVRILPTRVPKPTLRVRALNLTYKYSFDMGQVTETDMYYLQDEDLARQLVELGYRGSGDTLQRYEMLMSVPHGKINAEQQCSTIHSESYCGSTISERLSIRRLPCF